MLLFNLSFGRVRSEERFPIPIARLPPTRHVRQSNNSPSRILAVVREGSKRFRLPNPTLCFFRVALFLADSHFAAKAGF